ncbi:MAG: long-chain-acyl-CoA synthetase [Pseudomonadales bacterium]|jgi:citronellyl-CoA synthetase
MGIGAKMVDVARTLTNVPTLLALKRGMKMRPLDERDCFAAQVARNAQAFPDRIAMIFEGQTLTWAEFNALSNRYAHAFKARGLTRGDTVSVIMENRIEFLATIVGLNKIGVIAGLINTNLRGKPLVHCITVTESTMCVFGEELGDALAEVKADLPLQEGSGYLFVPDSGAAAAPNWAGDMAELSADADSGDPPDTSELTLGDDSLYIFTSGTTGLPKAAVLSNRRFLASSGLAHRAGLRCTEQDRLYICLPLYHGTGLLIGAGAAFSSGASMFIRRRFSASNFLHEVREHQTNCLIYIGELCRYLTNTPARPDDHDNPLENIMGNGMRPDVWMDFKNRYDVKRVSEFYGASEGNVSFANLLNKDCTIGMTTAKIALVAYDVDADELITDANGRCIEVESGEPGLLLGHINENAVFEGYTDKAASEKKILRNAFENGDAWFNSGDLIREIDVGYSLGYRHYQFVDRLGDTFRWKSENVSTNEVGELVNGFPQVKFCNVYGVEVPRADGRAGMAALTLEDDVAQLDIEGFSTYISDSLPAYARPVFLRIQNDIDVTGTFKMVKGDLRKQGYSLDEVEDPMYVLKPGEKVYAPLTTEFTALISSGDAGF